MAKSGKSFHDSLRKKTNIIVSTFLFTPEMWPDDSPTQMIKTKDKTIEQQDVYSPRS